MMPKNLSKDVTNPEVPVSVVVDDAIGRGNEKTRRPTPEHELTEQEQIVVRTEPGAATANDGKFRREFMLRARDDWSDPQHEEMHAANCITVLSEAMTRGLHPKGKAIFEGVRETSQHGSSLLVYSVNVVPAGLDTEPETTFAPSAALR
jgi:hypothetical protein